MQESCGLNRRFFFNCCGSSHLKGIFQGSHCMILLVYYKSTILVVLYYFVLVMLFVFQSTKYTICSWNEMLFQLDFQQINVKCWKSSWNPFTDRNNYPICIFFGDLYTTIVEEKTLIFRRNKCFYGDICRRKCLYQAVCRSSICLR